MSEPLTLTGRVSSGEFVRSSDPCQECDMHCCSLREPGTYITIHLDDDAPLTGGRVTITWDPR